MSHLRKLKYHEQKLLKKTNFLEWKQDKSAREATILHRYHISRREDYQYYNRLLGKILSLTNQLGQLPQDDEFRIRMTEQLTEKLFNMGLLSDERSLAAVEKITASSFCRRRLPVVMVRLKMAQTITEADTLVRHGHVRVGTDLVSDPAYLVTREMEDYVTWVDSSKIKRHIMKYNDALDDFDLLGE
ncbi:uncharacterized protein [Blastocystis hominis]|uniref:U3 small nucleolar ribonucleoprotein protein IMP3 n=1 Tax=Blastocystis hominis TaxID=12968 RepID=D8LY92_BLAHO|nr:uncharacterized protein [Blastocystis hominis]CBK20547.2 unnamed protein product [Blastocystis hominis]|eukprot:XP_012894595.1 uncharacterized protein [Blastocystis hominis]